jgi:signal transduction histidine kinase
VRRRSSSPTRRTSCARRLPGCGCGWRKRAPARTATRRGGIWTPGCASSTGCLILSRTGEREEPGEEIDLAEAVADARRRWARTAAAREIALSVETGAAGAVWASRADLDRAVDAVLENAIHYTPVGGHVTVRAAGAAIEVLDDGPGLAPGEEDEVFARFHRGRAGRAGARGTGLGLPIARELMRCWGGDAVLTNRPGGGASATLTARAFTGSFPSDP